MSPCMLNRSSPTSSPFSSSESSSTSTSTSTSSSVIDIMELKDQLLVMIRKESTMYNHNTCNSPQPHKFPLLYALFRWGESQQHQQQQQQQQQYSPPSKESRPAIDSEKLSQWRQLIVSWMYVIAATFQLHPSIVSAASYYLDRAVASSDILDPQRCDPLEYQIVALTCFNLAIKCYESRIFPMSELLKLSQGDIQEQDMIPMEQKLLIALEWKMHPPTPSCFLELYLQTLQQSSSSSSSSRRNHQDDDVLPWIKVKNQTEQLIQHINCSGKFRHYPPSIIALGSLLIVLHKLLLLPSSRLGFLIGQESVQIMLLELQTMLIESHSREILSMAVANFEPLCTIQVPIILAVEEKEQSMTDTCTDDDVPTVATADDISYQEDLQNYDDDDDDDDNNKDQDHSNPVQREHEQERNCCSCTKDLMCLTKRSQCRPRRKHSPSHVVIER